MEKVMTLSAGEIPLIYRTLWEKQGRSMIFFLFLTVCLAPQSIRAQVDTLAVIGNAGAPGSQGHSVQLTLMNLQEIAGLQFTLETSHEMLAIDSVRTTPRSKGMMPHFNRENGKVILIDFNATHAINTGYGPVLEVFYSVSADASPGMVPIRMKDVVLSDPAGKAVPVVSIGGTFTIQ